MKNKFKVLYLVLCFFMTMQIVLPSFEVTFAAISDKNTMLIASGVTIKNNTTLQQVISKYGQAPKITTTSVFGGTANTFYKDGYEDLLYVETDEKGIVMSAGTCAKEFKSNLSNSGDPFNGTVNYMQGFTINNYKQGAIGVLVYNSNLFGNYITSRVEAPKLFAKWYENQYEYGKNLCEHTIPIVNCFLTRDGDDPIEFNEEVYDTLAKIKQNGKDVETYATENDKTDLYKNVGTSKNIYLGTYEALPNPFKAAYGASGYRATETKKYGYFTYHLTPTSNNDYDVDIEKYYVSKEFIQKGGEEVSLTADEQSKYEAAKAMYQKSIDEYNQSGSVDHKVEPVYKTVPLVAGEIYENRLIGAVDFLNAIRVAAGLPTVKHNSTLSKAAQYKSVLVVYVNNFTDLEVSNAHYPPKPDEVSQEFYDTAMNNMGAENLYNGSIISSIYNAINDGYGDPITCGHRYNLLEPGHTDFGLGEAAGQSTHRLSGTQAYSNEIVAWPSDGITPMEAYTGGYWTCRFYKNYQVTADTTVEVIRLNDNKTWKFETRSTAGTNKFAVNGGILSFYNQDLTGKAGNVYKFIIHNVKNTATGNVTDYTYRTVFKSLYSDDTVALKYPESISLEKTEYVLDKNQQINLKTIFGGENVTEVCVKFSSDSEQVAKVDQYGTVTGLKPGTANITVTTLNGKTATAKVKVIDGIALGENTTTVLLNNVMKLNVLVPENVSVTYKSSNPKVAQVDSNGNVTAKSLGKTTITITSSNNKKVEVEVNVIKYQKGDLDKNNIVNANDAAIALDLYKYGNVSEEELQIGDMDNNGIINANDAALILDIYKYGN